MSQQGYSVEGLQHGIERCKVNIEQLEDAIKKERNTIKEYKLMINDVQQAKKDHAEAKRLSRTVDVGRELPKG